MLLSAIVVGAVVVLTLAVVGPDLLDGWKKWRGVQRLAREGHHRSAAALLNTVGSVLLVRRSVRNADMLSELRLEATRKVCSPAVQVVMVRHGVSGESMRTMWETPAVLRWMWLRVWDRDAARKLLEAMPRVPNQWALQPVVIPVVLFAWMQFLNDLEKQFMMSFVSREDLWFVRWLPGGLEAWMRFATSDVDKLHHLTWALREPRVEKKLLRASEHLPGVPRALALATGGREALLRWFGPEAREDLVAGVAKEFPGSLDDLRSVLSAM